MSGVGAEQLLSKQRLVFGEGDAERRGLVGHLHFGILPLPPECYPAVFGERRHAETPSARR